MFKLYVAIALIIESSLLAMISSLTGEPRVLLGALALIPATIVGAFALRSVMTAPSRKLRSISPESIASYESPEEEPGSAERGPGELSRSIVERSEEIRRTMSESPSEVQVEMCAIGYRACVNDMIALTHQINAALPRANFLEKMRLRAARRRATDSLAKARQSLPPSALRATRQELQ
jgi:hypothetical protein